MTVTPMTVTTATETLTTEMPMTVTSRGVTLSVAGRPPACGPPGAGPPPSRWHCAPGSRQPLPVGADALCPSVRHPMHHTSVPHTVTEVGDETGRDHVNFATVRKSP